MLSNLSIVSPIFREIVNKSNLDGVEYKNNLQHKSLEVNKSDFIIMAVIVIISSLFNATSIYLISRKKRLRPVDFFVGNLSFCTLLMSVSILGVVSLTKLVNIFAFSRQWFCSFINCAKYFPGTLNSLASFGLSFERVRSLKISATTSSGNATTSRSIVLIWLTAAIITLPTVFTSAYNNTTSESTPFSASKSCKRIPLFNSKLVDILYEIFKFFFIHIIVSFFLLYELYLIRSKIKYLCVFSIPGERLRKKVCRVRFAFFYSLILISLWISTGSLHLYYKIPIWFTSSSSKATNEYKARSSKVLNFLRATLLVYLLVNPVAVFFSNQELKIFRYLICCKRVRNRMNAANLITNSGDDQSRRRPSATVCDGEHSISRFASQQPSTSLGVRAHEDLERPDEFNELEESDTEPGNKAIITDTVTMEVVNRKLPKIMC